MIREVISKVAGISSLVHCLHPNDPVLTFGEYLIPRSGTLQGGPLSRPLFAIAHYPLLRAYIDIPSIFVNVTFLSTYADEVHHCSCRRCRC